MERAKFALVKARKAIWLLPFLALFATGCGNGQREVPDAAPAVYFWRTSLSLDSAERSFLYEYGISKVYLRLFDVVVREGKTVPSATISFPDTLPAGVRVVPVVFITEECLRADTAGLAGKLVERVAKMCHTHGLNTAGELQLDCDWTERSRAAYYDLLRRVKAGLQALPGGGWRLSVTVRLHQLSQEPPPADYGVLMLYNTGDMQRRECRNPIFDTGDIEPYLRHLKGYALPLSAAYPNYRWHRLFGGDRFKGLLYGENLRDSTVYEPLHADSLYRVVQGRTLHGVMQGNYDIHLSPGDEVVVSRPDAAEVVRLAERLEEARPGLHRGTVIYHLDKDCLKTYNHQQYEKLFHLR